MMLRKPLKCFWETLVGLCSHEDFPAYKVNDLQVVDLVRRTLTSLDALPGFLPCFTGLELTIPVFELHDRASLEMMAELRSENH